MSGLTIISSGLNGNQTKCYLKLKPTKKFRRANAVTITSIQEVLIQAFKLALLELQLQIQIQVKKIYYLLQQKDL